MLIDLKKEANMKKTFLLLLLLFAVMLFGCKKSASPTQPGNSQLRMDTAKNYNASSVYQGYSQYSYTQSGLVSQSAYYNLSGVKQNYQGYLYDVNGEMTAAYFCDASGVTQDAVSFTYDMSSRPLVQTYYNTGSMIPANISSINMFEYNTSGQMSKISYLNASSFMQYYLSFTYNASGQLSQATSYDPSDVMQWYRTYTCNAAGNVTQMTDYNVSDVVQDYTTYTYDTDGRVTRASYYSASSVLQSYTNMQYIPGSSAFNYASPTDIYNLIVLN
jgi:uncharacterized protein YcfL